MAPALLSRSLDPALGAITGVLAFYLNQTNPRTAPPPGESLSELIHWKRQKMEAERSAKVDKEADNELTSALEEIMREEKRN